MSERGQGVMGSSPVLKIYYLLSLAVFQLGSGSKCIMLTVNEIIGLGRLIIQKEDYQPLFKLIDGPHSTL